MAVRKNPKTELERKIARLQRELRDYKKIVRNSRQAESALKESEERFRSVFQNSAVAITVADARERITAWNEHAERLFGMSRKDLFLLPLRKIYPKEEWKKIREARIREKGIQHHMETRVVTKKGKSIDVEISISLIKDAKGRIAGSIGVIHDISERKKAEDLLRKSEAMFRTVFENSAAAITVVDAKERIISWNKFMENLLGMTADDLYMKPVSELYPKAEWKRIRVADIRRKGNREHFETKMIRKGGETVEVDISISVLKDLDGAVTGAIGVIRDISERRRAEEALRESEMKFRSVFENSAVAITVANANERLMSWNSFTEKLLGMTREDLYLRKISELYPAEEWKRIRSYDIRTKGIQHHLETKMLTATGETIDIDVSISVLKDTSGNITGSIGVIRDISERKKAEVELRKSEERFRTVFENSAVAITVADSKERIISWNKQAEQLLGATEEDLYLKPVCALYTEEEWRRIRSYDLRKKGTHHHLETQMLRKDGRLLDVEVSISVLKDPDGTVSGSIGIIRDISERKRAESERSAKEAAESATRAKSDFLASMSHEIRTPMNGILGMIELLQDMNLNDEQMEYLNAARNSADALLTIINDILDFSKIEAGKMTLEQIPFSLRDTLGDTITTLAVRAQAKGIELACHIPPQVPDALIGDPGRLRQIVVNLVGNGIKFTEHGEVVVRVDVEKQDGTGIGLHFAVMDTGIGVPREKQGSIFMSFQQADSSTTRRYGGTGLGLSISARLVELMQGKIWIESPCRALRTERGTPGSAFHFTGVFQADPDHEPAVSAVHEVNIRNLPVLIVDDNATQRQILEEMCLGWSMKPVLAANAAQALSIVDERTRSGQPFAFAIVDSEMPEMSGFDLAQRLRRRPGVESMRIMMMVSVGNPEEVARSKEMGFGVPLKKPIQQSRLLDAMLMVLALPAAAARGRGSKRTARRSRGLSILVVEDNKVNQMVAQRLLERHGHQPVIAEDGKTALAMIARKQFDLVLMDIQLPEMDGYEVTRRIREGERKTGKHLPIVAMTANAMKGDREKCLEAGMDDYVSKPVRPEKLFQAIDNAVDPDAGCPEGTKDESSQEAGGSPPAGKDGSDFFDQAEGLAHAGDDRELYCKILKVFLEQGPLQLEKIEKALEEGAASDAEREAHGLKGASANVGAIRLGQLALKMEDAAEAGRLDGLKDDLQGLRNEFARVARYLKETFGV